MTARSAGRRARCATARAGTSAGTRSSAAAGTSAATDGALVEPVTVQGCDQGSGFSDVGTVTPETSMRDVIDALSEVYLDDGIAAWMAASNKMLGGERAIDLCRTAEGRARVCALAAALVDGAIF